MVNIISDFGLGGGDLASTGISHRNSTIRIFGIYPEIRGIFSPQKKTNCTGDCSTTSTVTIDWGSC
jgi:hypothetical protein